MIATLETQVVGKEQLKVPNFGVMMVKPHAHSWGFPTLLQQCIDGEIVLESPFVNHILTSGAVKVVKTLIRNLSQETKGMCPVEVIYAESIGTPYFEILKNCYRGDVTVFVVESTLEESELQRFFKEFKGCVGLVDDSGTVVKQASGVRGNFLEKRPFVSDDELNAMSTSEYAEAIEPILNNLLHTTDNFYETARLLNLILSDYDARELLSRRIDVKAFISENYPTTLKKYEENEI